MSIKSFKIIVAAVLVSTSCSGDAALKAAESEVAPRSEASSEVYVPVSIQHIERSDAHIAARVQALSELIVGEDIDQSWMAEAVWAETPSWGRPIPGRPNLSVFYDRANDDLLVLNDALTDGVPEFVQAIQSALTQGDEQELLEWSGYRDVGIGPESARDALANCIHALGDLGVIDETEFEVGEAHLGEQISGMGNSTASVEWIDEYRFYLNRKVNGIDVFGAGLNIGIHRDGDVSSIRVADLAIAKAPDGIEFGVKERVVSAEQIEAKLHGALPEGVLERKVQREMVAYVLPRGETSSVVYPLHVAMFSDVHASPNGPVPSRRLTRGFPITEVGGAVVELGPIPNPTPSEAGDPR
jgi:hypothetical protein